MPRPAIVTRSMRMSRAPWNWIDIVADGPACGVSVTCPAWSRRWNIP